MTISQDREYVLLSVKWSRSVGYLLFWGKQTKDDDPRSFSGYTMDLDECEKYTEKEIIENDFPFWSGQKFYELVMEDYEGTWAVKVKDLHNFGQKKTILWR